MVASIFCNRLQKLEGRQDIEGCSPDDPYDTGIFASIVLSRLPRGCRCLFSITQSLMIKSKCSL